MNERVSFPIQSSRHSKLEKADILEMTVKHLRNLQRVQMSGKFLHKFTCKTCENASTDKAAAHANARL